MNKYVVLKSLTILFSFCFLLDVAYGQSNKRKFVFTQNGKQIPVKNHKIQLKKEGFKIQLLLKKIDAVIYNASINATNLNSVKAGTPIEKLHCFRPGAIMADYSKNTHKHLLIKDENGGGWAFNAQINAIHYDKIESKGEWFLCTRTIDKLNIITPAQHKGEPLVKDYPFKKLYIIYNVNYDDENGKRQTTKDNYITIEFVD